MQLNNVSVLITGGGSGLGAATARAVAARGSRVAVLDQSSENAEKVASEVKGIAVVADVTDEEQVKAAIAKAESAHGIARVLVNCAGIGGSQRIVGKDGVYPLAKFARIINVNLIGTFRCITKSAAGMLTLPPLPDGDRGAIVNTASVAAEDGQIGQVAYTASKAGVVGITLVVARDLSGDGIRCNTILPGIFDTPLLARAPENVKAGLAAMVPHPKRLGRAEEYAHLAHTMITNGYFNGEDVRLDGAIRMAPR